MDYKIMKSLLTVVMHVSNRKEDLLDMFCSNDQFGIQVKIFIMRLLCCKLRLYAVDRYAKGILCSPFFTLYFYFIMDMILLTSYIFTKLSHSEKNKAL